MRGNTGNLGKVACLRIDGVRVVVSEGRTQCLDQAYFRRVDAINYTMVHDDGAQTRHLGITAVEDDDLGLVPVQRFFNLGIPDGVAGQIEGLFGGMGEDHSADLAKAIPQQGHDGIAAVPAFRLLQADAGELADLAQHGSLFIN